MAFIAGAEALEGISGAEAGAGGGSATDFIGGAGDFLKTTNSIFSGGLKLYKNITGLTTMKTEEDVKQNYLNNLYKLGLLNLGSPELNRKARGDYVHSRKISADYSTEAILDGLKNGKLPTGWTEDNAVSQGFATELMLAKRRKSINSELARKDIFDSDAYHVKKVANWFSNDIENRNNDEVLKAMRVY